VTRIIAGSARGRRLRVPEVGTRPTSDRAREALFSALAAADSLEDARVLDLYAGSGALGIEAVSRGAASAVLIENDKAAAQVCRENARVVADGAVRVIVGDVSRLVAAPPAEAGFDLAFLDPPYEMTNADVAKVLTDLAANGWLASGADLVVERTKGADFDWPPGFDGLRRRDYGGTVLWYGRRAGD